MPRGTDRREALRHTEARKAKKNPIYNIRFVEDHKVEGARKVANNLKEAQARNRRLQQLARPYMIHLLDDRGYTPLSENPNQ